MTPERIAEIRAMLEAATRMDPLPWVRRPHSVYVLNAYRSTVAVALAWEVATVIAAAPATIQELLDEVERQEEDAADLWEERVRLREALFLFASVIRSGEPWTEHCEVAMARATAPLGHHRAAETAGGE